MPRVGKHDFPFTERRFDNHRAERREKDTSVVSFPGHIRDRSSLDQYRLEYDLNPELKGSFSSIELLCVQEIRTVHVRKRIAQSVVVVLKHVWVN